jgi:hypothetical protein
MKTIDSLDSHTAQAFAGHELVDEYGDWMPNERVTSIQEVRPEEALPKRGVIKESTNRSDLEGEEQAFFKEEGFVTDSFPEVDASEALERTQKEAKSRSRADREKRGDLD